MTRLTHYASPLGSITLAARDGALTGLWFAEQKYFMVGVRAFAPAAPDAPPLREAAAWLDAYFAGQRPSARDLPLLPAGTPFQQAVWALLRDIPSGETVTYGQLAARLHSSARAVGGAVGHNPLSIIVPCHRVLGAGGALTGYAGGVDKKMWLLRHEGIDTARLLCYDISEGKQGGKYI